MPRKTKVYIAGPYSSPDPCINTKNAIDMADALMSIGYCPFLPHLTHFWHTVSPKPYDEWLEYDKNWVACCDAILRLPGLSHGADGEVQLAMKLGLNVYYSLDDLMRDLSRTIEIWYNISLVVTLFLSLPLDAMYVVV